MHARDRVGAGSHVLGVDCGNTGTRAVGGRHGQADGLTGIVRVAWWRRGDCDQGRRLIDDDLLRLVGQRLASSLGAPEPSSEPQIEAARTKSVRVLAMEIDYGGFAREISLPDDVDLERVRTDWTNGILWIEIPRLSHA